MYRDDGKICNVDKVFLLDMFIGILNKIMGMGIWGSFFRTIGSVSLNLEVDGCAGVDRDRDKPRFMVHGSFKYFNW